MTDAVLPYAALLWASAVLVALTLVQLLVSDVAGIRAKHVPGTPLAGSHDSFHFRAARAHGNSVENLGVLALLVVLAVAGGASPQWAGVAGWAYTAARAGHMAFYYADWRLARSVAFSAGVAAQAALLVLVLVALA